MSSWRRLVLHELKPREGTTRDIAKLSSLTEADVLLQVRDLNNRLREQLRLEVDPIEVKANGSWRIDGVAGLLRFNDQTELEVVPKFLDPEATGWRSDFFVLAVLVRTGHLLAHDDISAGVADRGALATLVARSLLRMHEENERRSIRSYRRRRLTEFSFDGDVDWESLLFPSSDGFTLDRIDLTRQNPHNATMAGALDVLAAEVGDPDTHSQLLYRSRALRPQRIPPRTSPPLPPRYAGWTTAYELSQLILNGLGLDLTVGQFSGPGFVMSTWSAWQQLCEYLVHRALPDRRVRPQHATRLGARGTIDVNVRPDITIEYQGQNSFLLDAKYKGRSGKRNTIASADLYESLAFLRATETKRIVLVYPSQLPLEQLRTGKWKEFDRVRVDDYEIVAMEIQLQGLASRDGFDRLVTGARANLTSGHTT